MYMIRAYFSLYYLHSLPFTQLPKYISNFGAFFFEKHFPSVLRCKYHMVLAIP